MPIGDNVNLTDRLIKKTTNKTSITSKASITSKTNKIRKASNTNRRGQPSRNPETTTYKTKKMTFYVKDDLLKKLYNFAYWDRHNITEAFNIVLTDGLKGKNTKPKE
jgi:hypothetical protein